jgi:hypothetical protein
MHLFTILMLSATASALPLSFIEPPIIGLAERKLFHKSNDDIIGLEREAFHDTNRDKFIDSKREPMHNTNGDKTVGP